MNKKENIFLLWFSRITFFAAGLFLVVFIILSVAVVAFPGNINDGKNSGMAPCTQELVVCLNEAATRDGYFRKISAVSSCSYHNYLCTAKLAYDKVF